MAGSRLAEASMAVTAHVGRVARLSQRRECHALTRRLPYRRLLAAQDAEHGKLMQTEMTTPALQPIIEPWRIAALVLIVVAAMLFVHAIDPATAEISDQQTLAASTDR
jgi:hypothetical protein